MGSDGLRRGALRFATAAAAFPIVAGLSVLVGWQFDVAALKSILPGIVNMNPVTAVGFIATGSSLLILLRAPPAWRPLAVALALLAGLSGALRLYSYASGVDLGQDAWLFHAKVVLVPRHNAIAPNTAFNFVLSATALVLLGRPRWRATAAQALAATAMVIAALTVIGYAFGVRQFYGVLTFFPMALHTGLAFLALGAGLLAAQPTVGFVRPLVADDPGGRLARRLVPVALLVPLLLGVLRLLGEQAGAYDSNFGVAIMVVSTAAVMVAVVLVESSGLSRADAARRAAEAEAARAREAVAEVERLRRAERFLARFVNTTAHELSTPLTPVVLDVRKLAAAPLPGPQQEVVQRLDRGVGRLRKVVGGIVAAAQLQAGDAVLERRPIDAAEVVAAAAQEAEGAARARRLDLRVAVEPGCRVEADPERLRQAVAHLLDNALRFTPSGGRVEVACRRDGRQVRVEVRDSGIGLAQEQLARLWHPYAQVHDDMEVTQAGSGLGLFVVARIAALHGGGVGVASDGRGKGASFWFTLPAS